MNANFGVSLHNRFEAVLIDAKTNKVKQTAKAENVVLNGYWEDAFANTSYVSLALGTGTGTPSVTDTNLFRFLGMRCISTYYDTRATSRIGPHEWKKVWVTTFTENQAIGELTEIGLGRGSSSSSSSWSSTNISKYYTHAVFTDAEGNPIRINKTDSDRLTLTVTVFLTLNWSDAGPVYPVINLRNPKIACDPRPDYVTGDSYYTAPISMWLLNENNIAADIKYQINTLPLRYLYSTLHATPTTPYTTNKPQLTFRNYTSSRVLSTQGNATNYSTYLIKCVNNYYAFVSLPNESVYPSRLLTLTTAADGLTTDFNFDIPILNTHNVKVYIDDVLQSSDTYVFNGLNFKHPQGWTSCDTLYISKIDWYPYSSGGGSDVYNPLSPIMYYREDSYTNNSNYVATYYYDFKTPYTVSAIGKCAPTSFVIERGVPTLYYSTDNENWTQINITQWSTIANYRNFANIDSKVINIDPISARYWKVEHPLLSASSYYADDKLWASILFGDPKPQLQFNTVPASGSVIKVEAYCDYPIKNSNWIIENGMSFDYAFTRI